MVTVTQVVTPSLHWWLDGQQDPQSMTYTPGQALQARIGIGLPAEAESSRDYGLLVFLADAETGNVIQGTVAALLMDGSQTFTLSPGETKEAEGSINPSELAAHAAAGMPLPVYLALAAYDAALEEIAARQAVLLEGAAPGMMEQMIPLIGVGLMGAVVGMVLPMSRKMLRRE